MDVKKKGNSFFLTENQAPMYGLSLSKMQAYTSILLTIAKKVIGRWSSLHNGCMRVQIPMGQERFEDEKIRVKERSYAPGLTMCREKYCFCTMVGLQMWFNCAKGNVENQNSFGYITS